MAIAASLFRLVRPIGRVVARLSGFCLIEIMPVAGRIAGIIVALVATSKAVPCVHEASLTRASALNAAVANRSDEAAVTVRRVLCIVV
ncbi:MAG: hypothetical protein ACTSU0_05385, partial [Alphaproteobacteria bacterium]